MGGENKLDIRFGKYRAIKQIGAGATSVVYLAEEDNRPPGADGAALEDGASGGDAFPNLEWGDGPIRPRYVAIKVVDFTDDRSKLSRRFRKLFATEAALTAQFDHPNIAKVFEWKMEEERAYLVMEFVEGRGLDQFVTMDKLLPMHQVVGIIFKIAMALDYAHRRGIVHRDIKPANVLLSNDNEVKLMDFGLALNIKKNVNVDSTFINGLGSPSYMSPEQIKGYTLNHQTDLYSLGVMFYQMLTGRLPFRGPNTAGLVYKIINTEAVAVTQLNPDIPELSDKVIKKSLEKDLYSRYRLGADMAKDLSAVRYQILDDKYIAPDDTRWKAVRGLPVLGALDDVDVWEMLRLSAWKVLPPATVLMTEGEPGKSFGFILEGDVEVEKGERAIAKLTRGDIVGEVAYLDSEGGTRSATVTALTRVIFLEVNPSAFAFATEELREEINRIATNAMVKRLRTATSLARRASPLAVHPAAVTEAEAEVVQASAPVAPQEALGWGAFSQVSANAADNQTHAPVRAPAAPLPAAAPAPMAPAAPATLGADNTNTGRTRNTSVVVQPLPAAAAAMIAQMALSGQDGKSAVLQPFDLGPEIPENPVPPPRPVSELPPDQVLTTELGAHFGDASPNATTDMGSFSSQPPISTSEIAPEFDVRGIPVDTAEMAANFARSQQVSTSDMSANFDRSQQISTSELAPNFDRSQQISTSELAPNFDRSQQISTTDLAPSFDMSQQFSTSELAPHFDASPLLTTELAARFDAPPPPPPRSAAPQKPLRPPVREFIQDSTQALAPEFMSANPPAYPSGPAPRVGGAPPGRGSAPSGAPAAAAFDMDKTVELKGGFVPEGDDRTVPEEQLGELFPPLPPVAPAAAPVPAAAPAPLPGADVKATPPAALRGTPPAALAAKPAPVFKPTPPKPGAAPQFQPEDFDKTVILSGGFEAQPPEEETPPFDDLFPPLKF